MFYAQQSIFFKREMEFMITRNSILGCHRDKVNRFQRMARTHPKLHEYCMGALGLGAFLDYIGVPRGDVGG